MNTTSHVSVTKWPWYTRGDFMFLYRFLCCRRRRRQILVHVITFWTTCWISFIFGAIVGPDLYITWLDFGWFLSWPWPWIFKVKHGICYISAKNGSIATKRKANISIDLKASNVTIRFDLGHDLDLEFSRWNMEFAISQPNVVRLPWNEKQTYRLNSRPQVWPMGLTLAMTLTFEFSRSNVIFTIWWPRSGVRIYQIVTGVTSDVGMPSTHLVVFCNRSSFETTLLILLSNTFINILLRF